jgi:hypothetical protein
MRDTYSYTSSGSQTYLIIVARRRLVERVGVPLFENYTTIEYMRRGGRKESARRVESMRGHSGQKVMQGAMGREGRKIRGGEGDAWLGQG